MVKALSVGVSYTDFWSYSFKDLKYIFKGYVAAHKEKTKELYLASLLTANMIGCLFSKENKIPTYEDLFESDTEEYQKKQIKIMTEQLKDFASKANKQRRLKNGRRET